MKTTVKTISIPIYMSAVFCLVAVGAHAIEVDSTAKTAQCDTDLEAHHGLKIIHRTEVKAGHLAELLTMHTKRVADTTEAATVHIARHFTAAGHKVGSMVTRTADKIEKKIDNLYE